MTTYPIADRIKASKADSSHSLPRAHLGFSQVFDFDMAPSLVDSTLGAWEVGSIGGKDASRIPVTLVLDLVHKSVMEHTSSKSHAKPDGEQGT